MNYFFGVLSFIYVAAIFLMAGSPVVSTLSRFNPYSLLHIPLYAVLAFLLVLAIVPSKFFRFRGTDTVHHPESGKDPNHPGELARAHLKARFVIVGLIGLVVAVADEYHQSFIPTRDASFSDVLLDVVGIALALFLIRIWLKQLEVRSERLKFINDQ